MVHQHTLTLHTSGHGQTHNLTRQVEQVVQASKIQTGVAHLFATGSTAAVGVMEFEPGLQRDLPEMLNRLIPPSLNYGHEQAWHDGNGHSHLQATLLGPSLGVPIAQGRLVLGAWQQIVHIDCDVRSRDRIIVVTVMGE